MARARSKENHEAITAKILGAIKTGATVEAACSLARIARQTFYNWLKKDTVLKADYEEALAHSEIFLVSEIRKDPSWQSKAWLLERRFPERWGRRAVIDEGTQERGVLLIPVKPK